MRAWLAITPEKSEQTNKQMYGGELPDIPFEYGHLPQFLEDAGTSLRGFDGHAPLTFTEIKSWSELMGIDLTSFESEALHKMSVAFTFVANNRDSECPIKTSDMAKKASAVNAGSWSAVGTRSG